MFYLLNLCIPLPPTAPKLWYFCRVAEGLASRACPLLWFPVVPLVLVLIHVSSQEGLGPAGMEITEQQDQLREMQACALLPQQLDLKKKNQYKPSCPTVFPGLSKDESSGFQWMPAASQDQAFIKKKKKSDQTKRTLSIRAVQMQPLSSQLQLGLQICTIEKEIGLTWFKQPQSGGINTESANS